DADAGADDEAATARCPRLPYAWSDPRDADANDATGSDPAATSTARNAASRNDAIARNASEARDAGHVHPKSRHDDATRGAPWSECRENQR
ncbi:MAG: hypothetical protein SGPRY_011053, partial [Prymnesium sp.]